MRCTPTIHELIVLTLPPRHWHLNYFAVSGNHPSMWWFCNQVRLLWLRTLRRRSQKAHLSWERFISLVDRFFPPHLLQLAACGRRGHAHRACGRLQPVPVSDCDRGLSFAVGEFERAPKRFHA
jgi:hypothetical protein